MKGYAYEDKYGFVHVVEAKTTAEESTQGTVLETDIAHAGGYPQITVLGEDELQDVVANIKKKIIFVGGNSKDGREANIDSLPADLQTILVKLGFNK